MGQQTPSAGVEIAAGWRLETFEMQDCCRNRNSENVFFQNCCDQICERQVVSGCAVEKSCLDCVLTCQGVCRCQQVLDSEIEFGQRQ